MVQKGLPSIAKKTGKFGPGIGSAHVNDPDRLDPRLRWLNAKEARGLAALDTAPELAFSSHNEVLVERISMCSYFHPFATAGDHRKHSASRCNHPHIMLQLRHVLFGRALFRE